MRGASERLPALLAIGLLCTAAAPAFLPKEAGAASVITSADPLNAPCLPGHDNRRSELCAQWKAADAAQDAALWTGRSFWLALLSALIGAGTLIAAFMAARYAKKAAEEASRSADIANAALVASERAWLIVEPIAESDMRVTATGGTQLFVSLKITNIGKTPALNAHTNMTFLNGPEDIPEAVAAHSKAHRERNERWSRTVLPGESYRRPWGLTEETGDGYSAVLIGCVTYETLPDRTLHQTAFCYYVGPKDYMTENRRNVPQQAIEFTVTTGGFAD